MEKLNQNLFNYATHELSQDAFLCWITSFAMEDIYYNGKDKDKLVCFAKDFIRKATGLNENDDIIVNEIKKQYKNIDVLIRYNNDNYLIIEDKTYTKEHDDQLQKYKNYLREDKIKEEKIKGLYYKIGFQCDLSATNEAGYTVILQKDILKIMNKYSDSITNEIWKNYFNYINNLNNIRQIPTDLLIKDWSYQQQQSFYDNFSNYNKDILLKNYGYVSNPSGGYYSMWIWLGDKNNKEKDLIKYNNHDIEIYLQVDYKYKKVSGQDNKYEGQMPIELRMSLKEKSTKEIYLKLKNEIINKIETLMQSYNFTPYNTKRTGKSMCIGKYTIISKNEILESATNILDKAIKDYTKLIKDILEIYK